jgi:hypothetical protein
MGWIFPQMGKNSRLSFVRAKQHSEAALFIFFAAATVTRIVSTYINRIMLSRKPQLAQLGFRVGALL